MIPDKVPKRRRRLHKASMLIDDEDIEWMSAVPTSQEDNIAYLLAEAEQMGDDFMIAYLHKKLRLMAAIGGARAKLVQEALVVQQPIGMIGAPETAKDE